MAIVLKQRSSDITGRHLLDQRLVDSDISDGVRDSKICRKFRFYHRTLEYLVLYQTYCLRDRLFTNSAVAKRTEKDAFYVIEVMFSRCRIRKMQRLLTGKTFSRDNHYE